MRHQPTQDEIESLYTRVANFVSARLRNSHSPSLAARALVHCPVLPTHYKVPLSGVNQLRIHGAIAHELDDLFPGWELGFLPTPDNSQLECTLLIPLECAITHRSSSKRRGGTAALYASQTAVAGGGPGIERIFMLLLLVAVFGLGGYLFLLNAALKQ